MEDSVMSSQADENAVEGLVIKKEIIDDSYPQFQNHLVKYEDIDPGDFIVKQEPDDTDLISIIKTEEDQEIISSMKLELIKEQKTKSVSKCSPLDKSLTNLTSLSSLGMNTRSTRRTKVLEPITILSSEVDLKSSKVDGSEMDSSVLNQNTGAERMNNSSGSSIRVRDTSVKTSPLRLVKMVNNKLDYWKRAESLLPPDKRFILGEHRCYSCDSKFSSLKEWLKHMVTYLKTQGCYPKKLFAEKRELAISNFSRSCSLYKCELCPKEKVQTFRSRTEVVRHVVCTHFKINLKCPVCSRKVSNEISLHAHLNYMHDFSRTHLLCKYCDYKTYDVFSLKSHIRIHTNQDTLKCDICNQKVPFNRMAQHVYRKHTQSSKRKYHQCSHCPYKTAHSRTFNSHVNAKHVKDTKYFCHYCNYSCIVKGSIQKHIFIKHFKKESSKNYQCDRCDKYTSHLSDLSNHFLKCHTSKPESYGCEYCEAVFTAKHQLYIHTNIVHLNRHEFQCNGCKCSYKNRDMLRQHVFKMHMISYVCHYCLRSYNKKTQLIIHINSRHGIGIDYKCPNCKYVAKSKQLLNQHMNVRHNPNAIIYYCFHCSHTNKIKFKLAQHMTTKHKDLLAKK